jgi:hypothetical protein
MELDKVFDFLGLNEFPFVSDVKHQPRRRLPARYLGSAHAFEGNSVRDHLLPTRRLTRCIFKPTPYEGHCLVGWGQS